MDRIVKVFLIWLAIIVVVLIGWAINFREFMEMGSEITGLFVARLVGMAFPPVGALLGYFY